MSSQENPSTEPFGHFEQSACSDCSHSFDARIAKDAGLTAAIIHERLACMPSSQEDIETFLDYLTFSQIKKSIEKLEGCGYISCIDGVYRVREEYR